MTTAPGKLHTTIRLTVVTVFLLATTLTAALAIGLQYYFGQAMARQTATELYTATSSGIAAQLDSVANINHNIIELLVGNPLLAETGDSEARLRLLCAVLARNPLYYGIYLGSDDGSFFEVINLENSSYARQALRAIPTDRWLVTTVHRAAQGYVRTYQYIGKDLQTRVVRSEPTEYDVTSRPWYQAAISSDTVTTTEPYLFAQLGVPGRTLSRRIDGTGIVVGIDMTMSTISAFLRQNAIAGWSEIYLYDSEGQVMASSLNELREGTVPDESMVSIAADNQSHGRLVESLYDGKNWLVFVAPTAGASGPNTKPLYLGIRAPLDQVVGPLLQKVKLSIAITAAFLLLFMPFSWLFANPIVHPIRQLANENDKVRRREYDQVERVSSRIQELDELSESMVNMVQAIRAHELAQRKLMDSFIELIAQAIDDKSAYTGGHCERVPELALMLAQRASESTLPAFSHFQLATEDQWREFRIAAWLHDCGKITTPEHIVDKGSKLETIYNRIHEVRMRFEVLWRDAEIDYWKGMTDNSGDPTNLAEVRLAKQRQLEDDFNFVAECNVGGESLGVDEQNRLKDIAKFTWQRNFDDRIGLSPMEELRLSAAARALPAQEFLLRDKAEHIVARSGKKGYPPEFGINMDVPDNLCNLGEVYNLSVSRGTLTAEDRFRINEHMISTIKMLESLPFPEELKNVPRYASTHHETMRGSGYPRKLSGEQLSIPERILAVADIFEALTASDRPYKKAKPVSVALDILQQMALDNHIDQDCFQLFVREKVYLQYAREYLEPAQIDAVDVGKYLADVA